MQEDTAEAKRTKKQRSWVLGNKHFASVKKKCLGDCVYVDLRDRLEYADILGDGGPSEPRTTYYGRLASGENEPTWVD